MSLQLKSLDFIVVGEGIVTGKVILAGIDPVSYTHLTLPTILRV